MHRVGIELIWCWAFRAAFRTLILTPLHMFVCVKERERENGRGEWEEAGRNYTEGGEREGEAER